MAAQRANWLETERRTVRAGWIGGGCLSGGGSMVTEEESLEEETGGGGGGGTAVMERSAVEMRWWR